MAGYYGGWLDGLLMRFTEAMFTIPQLFLLLVMAKFFAGKIPTIQFLGRSFSGSVIVIIVIIGLTSWMYLARIVRADFLSLKEREFVVAAHTIGTRNRAIIFRHILPNTMAPIIVCCHAGRRQRHPLRGLHQLPGHGRPGAHRHLGQHARRRLQLHRDRALVVVLSRAADRADRAQHQLSWATVCATPSIRLLSPDRPEPDRGGLDTHHFDPGHQCSAPPGCLQDASLTHVSAGVVPAQGHSV